jgi:hypothetical protein
MQEQTVERDRLLLEREEIVGSPRRLSGDRLVLPAPLAAVMRVRRRMEEHAATRMRRSTDAAVCARALGAQAVLGERSS